jgi:hypothetical protein
MNSMVMQADIISNWEDRHESLFGVELVKLNHRLIDSGLFSREALGRVIERCPSEHLGLRAMGTEIDEVFGEFEARMPGFKTFKRNLGVLISSPNANVFYHADIQGQSLWQIEGSKSVYIYPRSEIFITPENVERILLRETAEDMPYENWFDDYATHVDLKPGEMVSWPLYAPHRVKNHDCLNTAFCDARWVSRTARRATTACMSIRRPQRRSCGRSSASRSPATW